MRTTALVLFSLALTACGGEPAPAPSPSAASPTASPTPRAPAGTLFESEVGSVRIEVPEGAQVERTLTGRPLMSDGWRLVWGGQPVGEGSGLVRLAIEARPEGDAPGRVVEMLQVGASQAPGVVESCRSYGLKGPSEQSVDNPMIDGREWSAVRNSDAGMSQQISALDLRTVAGGACWAVARISYAVRAAEPLSDDAPSQAEAARALDAALQSLKIVETTP